MDRASVDPSTHTHRILELLADKYCGIQLLPACSKLDVLLLYQTSEIQNSITGQTIVEKLFSSVCHIPSQYPLCSFNHPLFTILRTCVGDAEYHPSSVVALQILR